MSDDDDVEWEYEDESDAADDGGATGEPQPIINTSTRNVNDGGGSAAADFQYSRGETEEEDDGDVDWEDAVQPIEEPPASDDDQDDDDDDATEQTVGDLNAVNWDHINSVLQREADKDRANGTSTGKPTKRAAVRMTKHDKAHELALHKSHLLLLLAAQLRMNALCQSRVVRGLLLSLTSDSAFDFFADLADAQPLTYALELLVRWFHAAFRLATEADMEEEDAEAPLTESNLLRVVFTRCGSAAELALLFTTLCRALGLRTRLTIAMDPIVVQRHSNAAELAATASTPLPGNATRKRTRRVVTAEEGDERTTVASSRSLWAWCEVLNSKTTHWIAVDAVRKVVNRSHAIGALRGKYLPLTYVVSVDDDGYLIDVSARYVDRWSKTMPLRLAHDWLLQSLQLMSNHVATSDGDLIGMRGAERTKLQQLAEAEAMPTSLEAFKKHHVYCLERHLGQVECVYPRKAVGLFKGHAVFLRKAVQATRTWYQWRRLGRKVRESDKEKPIKRLVKKGGNGDTGDDTEATRASAVGRALYGYWQTDEIVPPRVDGVTVPKNTYGNIELWSPAHLPLGAVHLQLPRIDKVAQQLGVDFAAAVVGFESRDGVNYPQFDGIVVAEAVAETLLDAHAHVQQTMIEKAIDKNQQLIAKRWERLVKRLLLKARLNDEYGEV